MQSDAAVMRYQEWMNPASPVHTGPESYLWQSYLPVQAALLFCTATRVPFRAAALMRYFVTSFFSFFLHKFKSDEPPGTDNEPPFLSRWFA